MECKRTVTDLARAGNKGEYSLSRSPKVLSRKGYSQSRRKIIRKLNGRCHGNVDEKEIIRRLNNKELGEFCIQISSTGYWEKSRDFARKMGFVDQTTASERT